MKFFHISDLHIGLRLYNRSMDKEQAHVLSQIVRYAGERRPKAVLIAGDIYDKAVPSAEAVELFDRFLSDLTEALQGGTVMLISGNHDSGPRIDLYRSILKRQHVHAIGQPPQTKEDHIEKVVLTDDHGPVNFYLLPFVKPSMVKEITGTDAKGNNLSYDETLRRLVGREAIDPAERNVLVSHQFYLPAGRDADSVERMESEIRTIGNIDQVGADVLEAFDYAALGHIHKPMRVGSEFLRYSGTPMTCSLSEEGQQKGVIEVEMGAKGDIKTDVLPLTMIHQVRQIRGTLDEVLRQASEDYVRIVLTDRADLNVIDMQDRIRHAFPNLLEIRRERYAGDLPEAEAVVTEDLDPLSLLTAFLGDATEEEMAVLKDVLLTIDEKGGGEA